MKIKNFETVVHAFTDRLENNPDHAAIHVVERSGEEFALSYADLYQGASRAAGVFRELAVGTGDRLILILPTSRYFFYIYLAALFSGVIPVIVLLPKLNRPIHASTPHLGRLIKEVEARYIVASREIKEIMGPEFLSRTVTAEEMCGNGNPSNPDVVCRGADIAHLQATSGSTGTPRLAVVRHGNIAANVKEIGTAIRHRAGDILVSWLPPSHDMGLIGISYALYWQCPLVMADTLNFIRNPINWLRLISRFKGTLSPAPNSAFQMCARLAQLRTFEDLDLSSWRVALCGSEPVHEDTIQQFTETFTPYGFPETAMLPVYGLAEATLAVTLSDIDSIPHIDTIDADLAETTGFCSPASPDTKRTLKMVSVGMSIADHQLRIVNRDDVSLKKREREIGEIEFYGASVIDGYWGSSAKDNSLKRRDGFLRTGDLGYLADGKLYVTGRQKDIIIIHGRNFIPSQIEAFIRKVIKSKSPNTIAACGIQDTRSKTENLHLIIEQRTNLSGADKDRMEEEIRSALEEAFAITGTIIHWGTRGRIPRTTSGKIMRYLCRQLIQDQLI
jgi:acyl-CoA synthetase (AMP-forming)/AMP-acid ligase II